MGVHVRYMRWYKRHGKRQKGEGLDTAVLAYYRPETCELASWRGIGLCTYSYTRTAASLLLLLHQLLTACVTRSNIYVGCIYLLWGRPSTLWSSVKVRACATRPSLANMAVRLKPTQSQRHATHH